MGLKFFSENYLSSTTFVVFIILKIFWCIYITENKYSLAAGPLFKNTKRGQSMSRGTEKREERESGAGAGQRGKGGGVGREEEEAVKEEEEKKIKGMRRGKWEKGKKEKRITNLWLQLKLFIFEMPRIQLTQKEFIVMYSVRPGHLLPNDYIKNSNYPEQDYKEKKSSCYSSGADSETTTQRS